MTGGFVPTPTHDVVAYIPTLPEIMITVMIYAVGALILTVLYKIAISTRESIEQWDANPPAAAGK